MEGAFGSSQRRRRPSINITPLIDVMFLLLIFFMVSSTFRDQEGIDITLPEAQTGAQQERTNYTINVTAEDSLLFDGDPVTPDALKKIMGNLHRDEPDAVVTLSADEASSWQAVVHVIDTARDVGSTQLNIPTRRPGDATTESPVTSD
jgi:biopolymer transport protein ExbD